MEGVGIGIGPGGEWSASRPGRFTSRRKNLRYRLHRKLGGSQSRSGRGGEGKNKSHYCLCRELSRGCPAPTVVTILTEIGEAKCCICFVCYSCSLFSC